MIYAVHLHELSDKEKAKRLFGGGNYFFALFVPDLAKRSLKTESGEEIYGRIHGKEEYYDDWALKLFEENRNNPDVIWGYEGYRHCCGSCFNEMQKNKKAGKGAYPDSYHEHLCFKGHSQNLEETIVSLNGGRDVMGEIGIVPKAYCPPNHLYTKDTEAGLRKLGCKYLIIRNGFDYFAPGKVDVPAYEDDGLVVLPESDFKTSKSPLGMVYYSEVIKGDFSRFLGILKLSEHIENLTIEKKPAMKAAINYNATISYKRLIDLGNHRKLVRFKNFLEHARKKRHFST
jgi:hypothetical protein